MTTEFARAAQKQRSSTNVEILAYVRVALDESSEADGNGRPSVQHCVQGAATFTNIDSGAGRVYEVTGSVRRVIEEVEASLSLAGESDICLAITANGRHIGIRGSNRRYHISSREETVPIEPLG